MTIQSTVDSHWVHALHWKHRACSHHRNSPPIKKPKWVNVTSPNQIPINTVCCLEELKLNLILMLSSSFVEAIFGGLMQQTNQPLVTHRHSNTAVPKLADCLRLWRCVGFYKTYQQSKIDSGYLSNKKSCRAKKIAVNRQSASKKPTQKTTFRRSRVSTLPWPPALVQSTQTSLTGWFWIWKETKKKRDPQTSEVVQRKDIDMRGRL